MKKFLLSIIMVLVAPAAFAATVLSNGTIEFQVGVLTSGQSVQFDYTASEDLLVSDISLSGTGFDTSSDLANLDFDVLGSTYNFSTVTPNVGTSFGVGVIPSFNAASGSAFSILVTNTGSVLPVQFTFTFQTTSGGFSGPAVPVPASAGLLASGLLGLGVARRLRKKA